MEECTINKKKYNYSPLSEREEYIGKIIVNSAFKVHQTLSSGLLEKIYELCLAHEIKKTF